jgi:hypothetical protein
LTPPHSSRNRVSPIEDLFDVSTDKRASLYATLLRLSRVEWAEDELAVPTARPLSPCYALRS